jgi:hypothetical protein
MRFVETPPSIGSFVISSPGTPQGAKEVLHPLKSERLISFLNWLIRNP